MSRLCVAAPRFAGLPAAAFLLVLAGGTACATDLYKWTDSKGVVHYSDTPPPKGGDPAQRVHVNSTESSTTNSAEEKPAAKPEAEQNKPPAAPAPTSLPDTPDNRKRVCAQAQAQVEMLQSKYQVADSSGKPLDDKTRAEHIASAKEAVATYCQNPG